jgi:3-methyladenine DNA glycosylase AlkD
MPAEVQTPLPDRESDEAAFRVSPLGRRVRPPAYGRWVRDLRLLASGRDADVFEVGPERVLRRYRDGRDVTGEAEVMRHVRRFGYPVPELHSTGAGEMILQRLHGPTMLEALALGTMSAEDAGEELAQLLARLRTVPALGTADPAARLLHLDLHPGNVVLTAAGPVVIDWCNATDGPPELDVGMTALIMAQVAVGGGPHAEAARTLLDALLRCTAVGPGRLDAVVARRRADPNLTSDERDLLLAAAGLVSRDDRRPADRTRVNRPGGGRCSGTPSGCSSTTRSLECTAVTAIDDVRKDLADAADPERAAGLARYLQAVPGGYGEGDEMLGVRVPVQRKIAERHWRALSPADAGTLLHSPVHEERLTAVFVLVRQFRSGDEEVQQQVVDLVLANTDRLNNWDLVDSCAPHVLGPWLAGRDRAVLDRLAASELVWDRRIAVMSTFAFIRDGEYGPTLGLARQLLHDPYDLIHKAVGWMLREIGNRDRATEERFLDQHAADMPRVMLRYAIEKFPAERRRHYLGLARHGR